MYSAGQFVTAFLVVSGALIAPILAAIVWKIGKSVLFPIEPAPEHPDAVDSRRAAARACAALPEPCDEDREWMLAARQQS